MPLEPFVYLPWEGRHRLYRAPAEIVEARDPADVRPALDRLRAAGRPAAGYLSYEAGLALEPRLAPLAGVPAPSEPPLLWFGLFGWVEEVDPTAGFDPAAAHLAAPVPLVDRAAHAAAIDRVQRLIAAGDIYQANLTFPCAVATAGDPRAMFARLRAARAPWSALVFTGAHWLLSASPELFFRLEGDRITTRPMKGTAARGRNPQEDAALAAGLAADPKQRAENLMIVDLLRNDLSAVAAPGSVAVPRLFEVERYPSLHQLTSTVTARLADGRDAVDLLARLFPCGSITGAPKIRAAEVIAATEPHPRGPYTGAIGFIDSPADAGFNVAIRTLVLAHGEGTARLGLGSGIVADSSAAEEWRECLLKGRFVEGGVPMFDLIETMRFNALDGLVELERHLARMKASAAALGFAFDRHGVRNELQAATFRLVRDARVRLRLARSGAVAIEVTAPPMAPEGPVEVAVAPLPVAPDDVRLAHKTSDRDFYDEPRRAAGTFEIAFVRGDGLVTEGSFTNIFVERDGALVTPPLARGLLPGVLRARLIEEGRAIEGDITPDDLAGGFLIGNAVRGLMPARLVAASAKAPL